MDKWAKPGNLPENNDLPEIRGHWKEDTFPFSFFGTPKGWQRWNKSHTVVM
jgi:hypothetical protein